MNKQTQKLTEINADLRRLQEGSLFIEELNFRADSGYSISTIYRRADGIIKRAFREAMAKDPNLGFRLEDLPPFNPKNVLRITIEVLPAEDISLSPELKDQN